MGKPYDRSDLNNGGRQHQRGPEQEQGQEQVQEQAPAGGPQRQGGSDVEQPRGDGNAVNQADSGIGGMTPQRGADRSDHPTPAQQRPGSPRR
jgi:hypothetical protein